MSDFSSIFRQSLETGFIDSSIRSDYSYRPQFLVNDKLTGTKVLTTINNELSSCSEFWFSVAFITHSGLSTLKESLKELELRGIKGKILVSQYLNFTQPEALRKLIAFNNLEVRIDVNNSFHSKGYLFKKKDHYNLVVGSSNLTASALCSNKEWNLKVSARFDSHIVERAIHEFSSSFENACLVDRDYIDRYNQIYLQQKYIKAKTPELFKLSDTIKPNRMQEEALRNLISLRKNNKNKALLISATGTGKTFLSAFDIKNVNPKRVLFVVHRLNIAKAAMRTFKAIFGESKSVGIFSGKNKDFYSDFLFSTVQTISKPKYLELFKSNDFDYIVIDETHRAAAPSYQRVFDYFNPDFLLGMTATPERMDGLDIFKLFDHNIAYEIRLHSALEENMLCPFHYFGISDVSVNGDLLTDSSNFNLINRNERVNRIIEKADFYGCDDGEVRGLVFCSNVEDARDLSKRFNERNYKTVALAGDNNEHERELAIQRLESDDINEKLDYIFSVDIFNEGIDIPKVNQIILLRPTESAVVFVQQLGRGLRKIENKEYLTVIDFIGNYNNNFLIPVALFGDTSFNKDKLRNLMSGANKYIPGDSTINFDRISKEQIFKAIDGANMKNKKDLVNDYSMLKYKLGRIPMMMDFIDHGSRDPYLYISYSKSYFNFVASQEKSFKSKISAIDIKILELFSIEINNAKRVEECLIIEDLLTYGKVNVDKFKKKVFERYSFVLNDEIIDSCIINLNFDFIREKGPDRKYISSGRANNLSIVTVSGNYIYIDDSLRSSLKNPLFKSFLLDNIKYSISTFDRKFTNSIYNEGFILYNKYSRKDVFRILNWKENPVALNVGGYMMNSNKKDLAIFVNYDKEEDIASTTKYEDSFVNNSLFSWMSKNNRTLKSPEILAIRNYKEGLRIPLFIKKSNDEGQEFYYMGEVTPVEDSIKDSFIFDDKKNKKIPVVRIDFNLSTPVEDNLYSYLTDK